MSFRKKKQNERKKRKKRLKERLELLQQSKIFLTQQSNKIVNMNLSEEEKELQLRLIQRSLVIEDEQIKEIESRIGEHDASNG